MSRMWTVICAEVAVSILALCCVGVSQESAKITGPEIVKAGELVELEITVDRAPNFNGSGLQVSISGPGTYSLGAACGIPLGQKVCHLQFTYPEDVQSGTGRIAKISFTGGSRQIDLPFTAGFSFQVIGRPDLIFPTTADVKVKPSQVQLLRTEVVRLQQRLEDLKAGVRGQRDPLEKATLELLQNKIKNELDLIPKTEQQFQGLGDSQQAEAAHVFFADLYRGYEVAWDQVQEARGKRAILSPSTTCRHGPTKFGVFDRSSCV
jgi:hypothetical protein